MSKYFSFNEMWQSATADKLGIDNRPSPEIAMHLGELATDLDDIREAWGSGIIVSSGYRCDALNAAVGGSKTSAHVTGYAADLQPKNGKIEEFKAFIVNYLKNRKFDQCLLEASGKTQWVHYGKFNRKGQQRGQIFSLEV